MDGWAGAGGGGSPCRPETPGRPVDRQVGERRSIFVLALEDRPWYTEAVVERIFENRIRFRTAKGQANAKPEEQVRHPDAGRGLG